MAFQINVRGSMECMVADLRRMQSDVADKAVVRALNKVADQSKTSAAREIKAAGYNLKVSDIKNNLTVHRASPGNLTARVRASGKPIPLIKYGARQTSKGVSVNVLNGRKVIAGAFIATMPSGHKGVFVRVGRAHKKVVRGSRVKWSGLPIRELFGPSVPDGLSNKVVQGALQQLVVDKFPEILRQQIKYLSK